MNIQPLGDKVVIKNAPAEETTPTGILLPADAKEKPATAEVMAVGPGSLVDGKRVEMTVKVGDTVLFRKYAGTEFKYEGEEYLVLAESDILAIVK